MLMEPSISRAMGHLFGEMANLLWLVSFLTLFALFTWYYRGVIWQVGVGFLIWLVGTVNIIMHL